MSKDYGCKYCQHCLSLNDKQRICRLKPEYILDRFTKRTPKWCPLINSRKGIKQC